MTELKKDEQRKSDFIAMVSHELKTPLTSLNAYIQMLEARAKKSEDSFSINALGQARKQALKMTTMINGFLNVARLESGRISINKQRFDMAELVKESEAEIVPMYASHKIIFAPVVETFVNADPDKIGQVVSNLISNAVKYSKAGTTIKVACVTEGKDALLSVRDEGFGIQKGELGKLFDRYYRVESNHHISGFGIGLYLSAEIIAHHQGKIWAESEHEKGSTFYFSLPLNMV
jgi:two-component system sensor histidine kinase VicK